MSTFGTIIPPYTTTTSPALMSAVAMSPLRFILESFSFALGVTHLCLQVLCRSLIFNQIIYQDRMIFIEYSSELLRSRSAKHKYFIQKRFSFCLCLLRLNRLIR